MKLKTDVRKPGKQTINLSLVYLWWETWDVGGYDE